MFNKLFKFILPDDLYLRLFNPEEDNTNSGINVFLHINDMDNANTLTLKFRQGVSRFDVVTFLKKLHDEFTGSLDDNEDREDREEIKNIKEEFSNLFEFYSTKELDTAFTKLKIFTKTEYVFLGKSTITVSHDQDEDNKLWYTHFYKTSIHKGEENSECIGCICNKLSYVF
jgi:hypothetical protein